MTWFISHPHNNHTVTTVARGDTEAAAEHEASQLAHTLPLRTPVTYWWAEIGEESA